MTAATPAPGPAMLRELAAGMADAHRDGCTYELSGTWLHYVAEILAAVVKLHDADEALPPAIADICHDLGRSPDAVDRLRAAKERVEDTFDRAVDAVLDAVGEPLTAAAA